MKTYSWWGLFLVLWLSGPGGPDALTSRMTVRDFAQAAANAEKVSPLYLIAICGAETAWIMPEGPGLDGERGLCQVRKTTWEWLGCRGVPWSLPDDLACAAKMIAKGKAHPCHHRNLEHLAHWYNHGACWAGEAKTYHVTRAIDAMLAEQNRQMVKEFKRRQALLLACATCGGD